MAGQYQRLGNSRNDSEICDTQGALRRPGLGNPPDVLSPLLVVQIPLMQLIPVIRMKQWVTRTLWPETNKNNHSGNQASWYNVIHFTYCSINFYSTIVRMLNSETAVTFKGDTTGSRNYCSGAVRITRKRTASHVVIIYLPMSVPTWWLKDCAATASLLLSACIVSAILLLLLFVGLCPWTKSVQVSFCLFLHVGSR